MGIHRLLDPTLRLAEQLAEARERFSTSLHLYGSGGDATLMISLGVLLLGAAALLQRVLAGMRQNFGAAAPQPDAALQKDTNPMRTL